MTVEAWALFCATETLRTTTLLSALDVATGSALGELHRRPLLRLDSAHPRLSDSR